jgi:16S rRNA (cytosine1402-N4)-methyltransferase
VGRKCFYSDHQAYEAVVTMEAPEFAHLSVMRDEVVEWFAPVPSGWIVDGTLGGAGHATAILERHPHLSVLGIDQDPIAIKAATARLHAHHDRVSIVRGRSDSLCEYVESTGVSPIVGVFLDLGVSSVQFDVAERGFSYRNDAPLDMRMDQTSGQTAAELLATSTVGEITHLLRDFGDEAFAPRIARAIVARREENRPVERTLDLVEVVTNAIPAATRRTGGHPAKRSFQALRIAVNAELDVLERTLDAALDVLSPGGRLVVLSYHSGEDRIVKSRLRLAETGGCTCPPNGLPCACGALPRGRSLRRGVTRPSETEVATNPRAASALARVFDMFPTEVRSLATRQSATPKETRS